MPFLSLRLAVRSILLFLALAAALSLASQAQTTTVADPSIPVILVPTKGSRQFFAINQDRTLLGSATTQTSTFSASCAAPAGLSGTPSPSTSVVFDEGSRFLFETGIGATGTNAMVGVGAAFSGTTCNSTPPLPFYGTSVSLSSNDHRHQQVIVLSSNGPGTPDVVTSVSTNGAGDYYSPNTLSKRGQVSLDTGGSYSGMATDVDGTVGYTAITQLRTGTSAGGLWIYDPSFNRAVKVLGPGGVPLPAVNAFIVHNPSSVAGGLLVLTNQDLLTSANLSSPPAVTTPFTIIDMGQLGLLLQNHPTAASVTLPFVSTIQTSLSYYAIFGSAFNPVDNKLYLLTGGGSSASNPIRQVVRYDPADPAHPAETAVADVSAVPLYPASLPQIALNAAAGTMQIFTNAPNAVYSVNITGIGDTATTLAGTLFNDPNFNPTYIAANPLLGETYIASTSGKIDVVTLPSTLKPRAAINLNGPASGTAAPGQATSLQIESTFPLYESALNTTPITITATAASTGTSFTFATRNTVDTLSPTRYVSGTFPTADLYTVVASFPGDATYAAFTSPKVLVPVGTPLFATSISVVATSSSTTAGTATVTLSGTTYTPTGTIAIKDAANSAVLTTYTIPTGGFAVPLSIPFTIPAGTTAITATYSGDASNGQSISPAATISAPVVKSGTSLTLTAPTGQIVPNTSFNTTVALASVNGNVPTGQVILSATPTGSSASQVGSTTTAQAFGTGATISVSLPAGTYALQASYAGDANFNASSSNSVTVTVAASTTPVVTLTPASLTFTTAAGTTSAFQDVVLRNTGGGALAIAGIVASGAGFAQVNGCPASLVAGTQCTIRVSFAPLSGGQVTGAVTITDNAAGSPHKVTLTGTSSGPVATVSPAAPIFGSLTIGTSANTPTTVFLQNSGTGTLTVAAFSLDNTVDFDAHNVNCTAGRNLAAGAFCSVTVSFHPVAAGTKTATLQFTTSDTGSPQKAVLTGNGLARAACTDQDGDGLCDDWENFGVTVRVNGVDHFIDLPSMGADPRHKDVFVHADWMATDPSAKGAHTHQPIASAMAIVEKAFNDSPVINPDGTTGVHLHIDCGSDCIMDPVLGTLWGSASLAEKLPEAIFDTTSADVNKFKWDTFDTDSADFKATGRAVIFHHAIFGHDLDLGPTYSGLSRNGKTVGDGASDFVVTLGSVPGNPRGSALQQAGTLMHELGHNLGLQHGGQDGQNKKPNYLSVMNYAFQMSGLIVNNDGKGFSNGLYDYSRFALPDMDERALNEGTGIAADPKVFTGASAAFPGIEKYGTEWSCPAKTGAGSLTYTATIDGPVDWDCATPINSPKVRVDTNGDGGLGVFTSFSDWPVLTYRGGAIGGSGAAIAEAPIPEFQSDQVNTVLPPYRVEISGTGVLQTSPGGTIKLRFQVVNSGALADSYILTAGSPLGWASTTLTPSTLALAPGESTLVTVTYTVPAGTTAGTGDRIALKAVSQASARIYDAAESLVYASATPAPLTLSTSAVTFSQQPLNSTSVPMPLVLTNTGASPLSLTSLTASAQFSQTNDCGATLAMGDSCVVSLSFTPTAIGPRAGTLILVDSGSSSPETITLTGTAIAAQLGRSQIALSVAPLAIPSGRALMLTAKLAAVSGKLPTGTVTFFNDTATLGQTDVDASGTATLTTSSLATGIYDLYAVYAGDSSFYPLTAPDQTLTLVGTATTLTSSASTATAGTAIVLTATVTSNGGTPTGTITFLDGTSTLGTGTLNGVGVATFSTSTLAIGSHPITARYAATGTFPASASPAIIVVITGVPDFSIAAAPASLTLASGATGTATFTVTPINGYVGTIKLACGALPSYASCSFSPAQLAFATTAQSAQTATLNFGTTAQTSALLKPAAHRESGFSLAALIGLPCLGLGLFGFGRRHPHSRLAPLKLLLALVTLLGAASFSGCGSKAPAALQRTPAGTYAVQITMSDGATSHTVAYSITVN